jgi:V8-like Glu-specific endopeptidase
MPARNRLSVTSEHEVGDSHGRAKQAVKKTRGAKYKMKKFALALIATMLMAALGSQNATAFPLTSKNWGHKGVGLFYTPGFNFMGIIALSNCSGSLVRFKSSADTDLAMVLTNGHCIKTGSWGGMLQPGQVINNEPAQYDVDILSKDGATIGSQTSTRILYATMTDTDVTLFELPATYAAIEKETGTKALTLADSLPAMGMQIEIPSGYWKRTYACKTDVIIPTLKEADWTFKHSIRFSEPGCETIGGTSGSPLVSAQSGEVIGINNTGNEDGEACTINNPCEIDEQGNQTVHIHRSYGQQTYLFYGCLGKGANRINLTQPTCLLPKP